MKLKMLFIILLMVILLFPALRVEASDISLFRFNVSKGRERIKNRFFNPVFCGTGGFDKLDAKRTEIWAFKILLGNDAICDNFRKICKTYEARGKSGSHAYDMARKMHGKQLKSYFANHKLANESLRELYTNEKPATNSLCSDDDFIFTSPSINRCAYYGPIILIIEENKPRGLDLNSVAKAAKYYSIARAKKNTINRKFKIIAWDFVSDKDEYLIPSFVPSKDISGFLVTDVTKKMRQKLAIIRPPIVRKYQKKTYLKKAVIEISDKKDKILARFNLDTGAIKMFKNGKRSIPKGIFNAWKKRMGTAK